MPVEDIDLLEVAPPPPLDFQSNLPGLHACHTVLCYIVVFYPYFSTSLIPLWGLFTHLKKGWFLSMRSDLLRVAHLNILYKTNKNCTFAGYYFIQLTIFSTIFFHFYIETTKCVL